MAKIPFLSRLFGTGPQEEKEEELGASLPPEPVQPPAGPPSEATLQLPPEHALNKLWRLYLEQGGRCSVPVLTLLGPGGERLPAKQEKQELLRLQLAVNASANQRLALAQPKQEPGEDPPVLDAQAVAFTASDQLSAWLVIYPPVGGGRELDQEMLFGALAEAGVYFGVDEGLLKRLPQEPERYFRLFFAARGIPAVHGKNGYVVDLFARKLERRLVEDEFGQLNYASLNLVQNVAEGDVICRFIPPTEGQPGRTVTDMELPARDGRPASPPVGRNTQVSEDGKTLIASKSGHVEYTGRGFQVKPVLDIEGNVDYSTGNINFVGDVHVKGDVLSGFSIRAMGDITVEGVVESCSIEAGGDLTVVKGIVGNDEAVICAQRSIFTKFMENCCAYARVSVHTDCLVNCDVYSDGVVEVRSGRGAIIGGRIWAAQEISANSVGSEAERPAVICLGGLPCEEFERDVVTREIAEIEADLARTEQKPDSAQKLTHLSKTRVKLVLSRNKLAHINKDLEALRERGEEQNTGRLVCDIAYGGTEITIGSATVRLRHEVRPCTARLAEGEIIFL